MLFSLSTLYYRNSSAIPARTTSVGGGLTVFHEQAGIRQGRQQAEGRNQEARRRQAGPPHRKRAAGGHAAAGRYSAGMETRCRGPGGAVHQKGEQREVHGGGGEGGTAAAARCHSCGALGVRPGSAAAAAADTGQTTDDEASSASQHKQAACQPAQMDTEVSCAATRSRTACMVRLLGRSMGRPSARLHTPWLSTPSERDTPNSTAGRGCCGGGSRSVEEGRGKEPGAR